MKKINRTRFEEVLKSALELEIPYSTRSLRDYQPLLPTRLTPAAVLILFAYSRDSEEREMGPSLLFIRRAESVETHSGQMAFPGGQVDPEDQGESMMTALRETEEEVGISKESVRLLGKLPHLITSTLFSVDPVVGTLTQPIEEIQLKLNEDEISEAVWIPLRTLMNPESYREEKLMVGQKTYPIDVFEVNHYRIWGATGSMTKNLLDRLSAGDK